ncbi:MAG: hypothetical protein ACLQBB_08175 [Solirubrobacteraceae bacterium]
MSTSDDIYKRLRAARPDATSPPPPLAAILARIEGEAAPRPKRGPRVGHGRTLLLLALVSLALVGAGGGALLLTVGKPLAPAFVLPANPNTGLGQPIRSSLRLLPIRVADPQGGPPWGMRVIRTTRGLVCLQGGRVVDGQLGGLGSGYAFKGDGRFHPFLPADAIGIDACPTAASDGFAFIAGPPLTVTADGLPLAGENLWPGERVHCDLPGQEDWGVRCPQRQLRQVALGLLGPDATRITVRTPRGKLAVKPYGPEGAYLIVLPAQPHSNTSINSGGSGPFGSVSNAPEGAVLTISFRDGTHCQIPARTEREACKPPAGPQVASPPTSSEVSSPLHVSYLARVAHPASPLIADARSGNPERMQRFNGTPSGPALAISFQARLAVSNEASGYVVELQPREVAGCATPALIVSQPSEQTLAAGATVHLTVPLEDSCATSYTGRVFYAESTPPREAGVAHSLDERPLYQVIGSQYRPGEKGQRFPTVGRFEIVVP